MKYLPVVAAAAVGLVRPAAAHYIFSKLVLNGEASEDWQYIRQTTRAENYMPTKFTNTFDNLTPNDNDFRCNLGSFGSAANTDVAVVAAGDTLGMKLFYDAHIQHPGPGQVFMSKAPTGNVQEYEGDGEWFKIWESTICNEGGDLTTNAWCTWDMDQLEFQIPESVPAGEYLVRAEHIGLHGAHADEAEFFYSCAQIEVTGGGNGSPSVTYQIPGMYNNDMKLFNGANLWMDSAADIMADIYDTPIGDEAWTGGSSGSAPSTSENVASSVPATPVESTVAAVPVESTAAAVPVESTAAAVPVESTPAAVPDVPSYPPSHCVPSW